MENSHKKKLSLAYTVKLNSSILSFREQMFS